MKFYASVRVDIRRIGQIKDGDNVAGNRTKIKVVKKRGNTTSFGLRVYNAKANKSE